MTIEPLSEPAMRYVLANLRREDQAELDAARIVDPVAAFCDVLHECSGGIAVTARPVCAFGVRAHPKAPRVGIPWLVATEELSLNRRELLRAAPGIVSDMLKQYDMLMNLVHRHNEGALRFVRRLGFAVGSKAIGPGGEFFQFCRSACDV